MKSYRVAPILLAGFGLLIGLAGITGAGSLKRARDAYRDVTALNGRDRRVEKTLAVVGTSIYVGGVLARVYLMDASNAQAPQYRARLLAQRASIEKAFEELDQILPEENHSLLQRLRVEEEGYWDALDPLFAWTPQEKATQSWGFLRRQILPRREAALSLAREIASSAQANLERQRQEIDSRQTALAAFIRRMLAVTVLFGLAIAGVAFAWIAHLESRSQEQRRRTEADEGELRRLSRQLVQAQEEERKSISRELHDEIGQMLTALRMEVGSLQDLRTAPASEFDEHVESAKRLSAHSLRVLRDIAMGLRPSMLDDLGSAPRFNGPTFRAVAGAIVQSLRQTASTRGIPAAHQQGCLLGSVPRRRLSPVRRTQLANQAGRRRATDSRRRSHRKRRHMAWQSR